MSLTKIFLLAFAFCNCLACSALADAAASPGGQCLVYIGTYTGPKSQGIYAARMDLTTGKLTPLGLVGEAQNPTFLDLDLPHRRLYSADEISHFNGRPTGAVSAFTIDPETGKLTLLNERSSAGGGPCHLVLDNSGRNLLVANYGGGNVAVLRVE